MSPRRLNHVALLVFAPILVLTGIGGFTSLGPRGPLSAAPAYNVFHLVAGAIGVLVLLSRRDGAVRAFNVGFGLVDLYQVLASAAHLFPERWFRWTTADDVLHVVIGVALIAIGVYRPRPPAPRRS